LQTLVRLDAPEAPLRYRTQDYEIEFRPGDFVQVNAGVNAQMVPLALDLLDLQPDDVVLDLEPLERLVRPIALARAVANLIDNAHSHGAPPFRLELRGRGATGFEIAMWDGGVGIPATDWERALVPFQRLDAARGDQGHSGLGLAIAARVARDHGGELQPRRVGGEGTPGFAVVLRGRSDLVTSGGDAVGEREDPPGTMTVVDPFRSP
jgi:two-component system osmolarity sensor histidine kinase EnvZ